MADIFFNSQVNMKITPVEPNNLVRLRDLEEHLEGVFTPTPEQQAAMDSGITAEKLAELEAKEFTPTPEQQDVLDSGITAEQLEEVTTTLDEVSGRNKPLQAVFDIVGDDTTVEYVFEHNWSTTNVTHEFYDKTTGSSVGAEFSRTDVNSVKVTFGLPLGVGNDLVLVLTASVDGSSNIPN
jgi:hypothetical protein